MLKAKQSKLEINPLRAFMCYTLLTFASAFSDSFVSCCICPITLLVRSYCLWRFSLFWSLLFCPKKRLEHMLVTGVALHLSNLFVCLFVLFICYTYFISYKYLKRIDGPKMFQCLLPLIFFAPIYKSIFINPLFLYFAIFIY